MPPTKFIIFFQDFYLSKVPIVGQLEQISYNTLLLLQQHACEQQQTNIFHISNTLFCHVYLHHQHYVINCKISLFSRRRLM
jgi:hypothetical protein